jgi:hypothetical protein
MANRAIALAAVLSRGTLPRPVHVPSDRPERVVAWVVDALARNGRAIGSGFTSSWVTASTFAVEHGQRFDGLVLFLFGEPLTAGKAQAIVASGARVANAYGFMQQGQVGMSCPAMQSEEVHLWDRDHAVIHRDRSGPDGAQVPALCFTSLSLEAPGVWLNVENDDTAAIERGVECDCLLGRIGMTTRLRSIRGISKVVAGGTTVVGELFETLVEQALPARFGGGPTDYQFMESEAGDQSTVISLRIHPRLGAVDQEQALALVRTALQRSENGAMASAVWASRLQVVRLAPTVTPAGKLLAFERIGTPIAQGVSGPPGARS